MYKLTTIKELTNRRALKLMLTAFAIAAFISLSALPAAAQTPTQVGDQMFLTGETVELANRATVRVHYSTNYLNAMILMGTVKVFSGSTGALLQSHELINPIAGVYSIAINRDDLREEGQPDTGCLPLWIVVAIKTSSGSRPEAEESVFVLRSTFELIDNQSGVMAGVWKTTNFLTTDRLPSKPIVFTGVK